MKILGVNQEKCSLCGACIEECGAGLFRRDQKSSGEKARVVHADPHRWCTGCGHCLAVCNRDAILYDSATPVTAPTGIEHPEQLCGYQTLLPFLQSKRSIRRYRSQGLERDQIMEVLEAMRCAPSGHNAQANRYLVITDRSVLDAISDHTIAVFKKFRVIVRMRKLLRPFLPTNLYKVLNSPGLVEGLEDMIQRRERGEDPILFEAPAVIVVYYPNMGSLSLLDPTIAFTYGMLAAHSLGLGSCWIGFAIQSMYKDKGMRKMLGVPPDMIIAGVMTLGYPLPVFHRIPPRNRTNVRWLENGKNSRDFASTDLVKGPGRFDDIADPTEAVAG
jgi:nitroreductase/NAD-dependent dihydropyrimidine dehydrogenase PreA subunit